MQVWVGIITIYALFFDDIKILAFDKANDDITNAVTLVCVITYVLELISLSIAQKGYFNSFYFWLDFVSTASMIPEVNWLWQEEVDIVD